MPLIKRYPNRKLYNTEQKRYITLDGIAALIRQGQEVQIVDHTTGEDLTAVTLSQIIFEQEKKEGGFLPKNVLAGLIQSGGETFGSLRRALSAPLELLYDIDEEIERRMQVLIQEGEIEEEEGLRVLDKLLAVGERAAAETHPQPSASAIKKALASRGIPSRDEIHKLARQIDDLAAKLDALTGKEEQA
ncbi:MAG: pesticidal protein Cry15Aa [Caldilineae bacterium]|nr:MAG: pesticidal protein Cry15Aa [Caldilineae bacterium]